MSVVSPLGTRGAGSSFAALTVCLFGKHWNLKSSWRWLGLLFLNCVGFFLTLRPRAALPLATLGLGYWVVGGVLHDKGVALDGQGEVPFFVVGVVTPWLANIAVSLRHEIDLDKAQAQALVTVRE